MVLIFLKIRWTRGVRILIFCCGNNQSIARDYLALVFSKFYLGHYIESLFLPGSRSLFFSLLPERVWTLSSDSTGIKFRFINYALLKEEIVERVIGDCGCLALFLKIGEKVKTSASGLSKLFRSKILSNTPQC